MAVRRPIAFAVALGICFGLSYARAQQNADITVDFSTMQVKTAQLSDRLYVLTVAPLSNVAVLIGDDGLLLVDTMAPQLHEKLMAAITDISPKPVRYVITTHIHGDHTGSHAALAKQGAVIVAHDNVRRRMLNDARWRATPESVPTITYSDTLSLNIYGEEVYIYHPAAAHTDGDSVVYFRTSNVVHVGDIPSSRRFPNVSTDAGGTVDGMMAAARQLTKIIKPDTRIVAGHLGPFVDLKDVEQEVAMLAAVKERVAAAIKDGKTEEQVIASKPTRGFDEGRLGGLLSADRFVSLVYRNLARTAK